MTNSCLQHTSDNVQHFQYIFAAISNVVCRFGVFCHIKCSRLSIHTSAMTMFYVLCSSFIYRRGSWHREITLCTNQSVSSFETSNVDRKLQLFISTQACYLGQFSAISVLCFVFDTIYCAKEILLVSYTCCDLITSSSEASCFWFCQVVEKQSLTL